MSPDRNVLIPWIRASPFGRRPPGRYVRSISSAASGGLWGFPFHR